MVKMIRERFQMGFSLNEYYFSLPALNELIIRNVNIPQKSSGKIYLHGFGGASQKAFGACIYAFSCNKESETELRLILC